MIVRRPSLAAAILVLALVPLFGPAASMQQAVKRPVEIEDVIAWKAMGTATISADGQWFGYRLSPQEGDAEVVLKRTRGDNKELKFPAGEQPQALIPGGTWQSAAPAAAAPALVTCVVVPGFDFADFRLHEG